MSFVPPGASAFRRGVENEDPLMGGALGAWVTEYEGAQLGAYLGEASEIATDAATGAAIGTVVPVVGTTIGGIVGGVVGAIKHFFGGKETTGLPQQPVHDRAWAHALAQKWFSYMDEYTSTDDFGYWTNEIMADGPVRAWVNFSRSAEPVAKGVAQRAAAQAATDGGPYVVSLGDTIPGSGGSTGAGPFTPGYVPPKGYATVQASLIPGVSNGVLLLGGAALLGVVLLSKRRR